MVIVTTIVFIQNKILLLVPFIMIWVSDIGAYFVGKSIGKHKLLPNVSPGKTLEGFIGGVVCACIFIAIAGYVLHWQTQQFSDVVHQAEEPKSLAAGAVRSLIFSSDDTLWVGTWGGGLSHQLKTNSTQFEHFTAQRDDPYSLSSNKVLALAFDTQRRLWVGTINGLNRLDAQRRHFSRFNGYSESRS